MVYDVTRRRTFLNIENWKNECFKAIGHPIPMIVVANKVDLEESRVVGTEEGKEYANELGFFYVESSALTGKNVEKAYTDLCRLMVDSVKKKDKEAI